MNPTSKSATLLILIALLTACVPARKYEELQSRYKSTQESETAALAKAQTAEAAMKEQSASVEDLTKRKANFFVKQAVDAASPSNFLLTNPTALRATLQSKGENLVKGLENLQSDLERGQGCGRVRRRRGRLPGRVRGVRGSTRRLG